MQRDVYTALAEAEGRGLEEGIRQGIERGRAEALIPLVPYLQRLLHLEVVSRERLQALSLVELEDLAARLQAELDARLANGS